MTDSREHVLIFFRDIGKTTVCESERSTNHNSHGLVGEREHASFSVFVAHVRNSYLKEAGSPAYPVVSSNRRIMHF